MACFTALVVGSRLSLYSLTFIEFVQRPVHYECYEITNLCAKTSRT